ncbi:MAG: TRAP transporter large permease subunit, partial [Clostridiales bacterium]|nr:TRAP transporter large permease subunit [Clostridiales bacterium]
GLGLTQNHIPQQLCDFFVGLSSQRWVVIICVNIALLILGCLMDCTPILVILSGTLALLAQQLGMDPVQFGVMVVLNVTLGLITPPVGIILFVTQKVANISTQRMFKSVLPYVAAMITVLLIVAFVPGLVTWLPNLFVK